MKQITFFDCSDYDKLFFEKECFEKYKTFFTKKSLNFSINLTEEMKESEIISCFTISVLSEKILNNFPKLELIALRCVGFNNIDIDYCKKNNIKVVNSRGYGNRTVAEFALGLLLDVSRNISKSYLSLLDNERKKYEAGIELKGKTIGIIGVGSIGSELVKISHGLGMNVLGYDLFKNKELIEKYDLKYLNLDDVLANSDFISLHSPLTKETYHMINEEKLSLMNENAIIVNTARGELIDTKALYKALSFGTIKGAGLDVLECEESFNDKDLKYDMDYLDKQTIKQILLNHEITKLDNVVITPHIAYDTQEAICNIHKITIDNINSYFSGKLKNNVY